MKINLLAIARPERDEYEAICRHFAKMSGRYAKLQTRELFDAKVTRAQESGAAAAQKRYAELFEPYMRGYTIALDPAGKLLDSEAFAGLLEGRSEVSLFIGGAYGHGDDFLKRCDAVVSLSPLTMSHKIAKAVLCEQLYRALTILNNHPYHK
ncbi:23S rRNA (pseudouridine(1915)-N(3))-methyltransferase RlmH [Hydrogenimonas sp.]